MNWLVAGLLVVGFAASGRPAATFDVKRFGAAGDASTLDTAAINRAIEACASAGGGTVYFPAGAYLTGTVHLKSKVTLSLDAGATILGSKRLADYPGPFEGLNPVPPLILGKGVHNVAIEGYGTIDGNRTFNPKGMEGMRGPHTVQIIEGKDITVRDVTFKDSANCALVLRHCERVNVDGMTAKGGWDGIQMYDVKNVTISNCRLFTGDDCVAGSHWENVTVSNCVLNTSCNGFRAGGRNVLINNCLIYGPGEFEHRTSQRRNLESGFQVLPNQGPPAQWYPNKVVAAGPVDNMILSNVTMSRVRSPVWIDYSADLPNRRNSLGVGRIIVNNLTATEVGRTPFYVFAPPDHPAKSIVLNNVRMTFAGGADETSSHAQGFSPFSVLESYGIYTRNVEHLELHDVRVGYRERDLRPALMAENIGTLEVDRFLAQREPTGASPFLLAGVKRMLMDGKEPAAAKVRIKGLELEAGQTIAGEPFPVTVTVENAGPDGLAEVPLRLGEELLSRRVWLRAGETARVRFVNLRPKEPGARIAQAGPLAKEFAVLPKTEGRPVAAPYRAFQNSDAQLQQLDGGFFYIRSRGGYAVLDRADQYGAIYLQDALPRNGAVLTRLENPDLRTHWLGRAGIIVRNDISKPGQSTGYLILGASPANGHSLEWDSDGDGRIDKRTELDGYTLWPHWLKLERRGARFIGYYGADGANWTKVGEVELPGADGALDAGLFAHQSSARFQGLQVSGQHEPERRRK